MILKSGSAAARVSVFPSPDCSLVLPRKPSRPVHSSFQPINKAAAPMMDKRCAVCSKRSSGFGFKPPGQPLKWYCSEHKPDGEKYLLDIPRLLL